MVIIYDEQPTAHQFLHGARHGLCSAFAPGTLPLTSSRVWALMSGLARRSESERPLKRSASPYESAGIALAGAGLGVGY